MTYYAMLYGVAAKLYRRKTTVA